MTRLGVCVRGCSGNRPLGRFGHCNERPDRADIHAILIKHIMARERPKKSGPFGAANFPSIDLGGYNKLR